MKSNKKLLCGLAIFFAGIFCLFIYLKLGFKNQSYSNDGKVGVQAVDVPLSTDQAHAEGGSHAQRVSDLKNDEVTHERYSNALKEFLSGFEGISKNTYSSAYDRLKAPLEKLDYDGISRALADLVYQDPWAQDEVVAILESLLTHHDVWVRYRSIEYLYLLGFGDIAREAAINILSDPSFVRNPDGLNTDLRITMADSLAKYRDEKLYSTLVNLYDRTGYIQLRDDLMKISAQDAWEVISPKVKLRASQTAMEWLGMAGDSNGLDFVTQILQDDSNDAAVINAAAWAKTRIDGDLVSANIIRDYVRQAIDGEQGNLPNMRDAIIYLGTFDDEESIKLLEDVAINTKWNTITDVAVANLVLNHQSKTVIGKDMIIEELTGGGTPLARELAITLAAYMSDDPEVRAAGEISDRTGSVDSWEKGLARKEWAFWGWADEYLIVPPIGD